MPSNRQGFIRVKVIDVSEGVWVRLTGVLRRGRPGFRSTLVAVLVGLFVLFAAGIATLRPGGGGVELTLDQLAGLAAERRIVSATLLDEDARVVGQWAAQPVSVAPVDAPPSVLLGDPSAAPTGAGVFAVAYPKSDATTSLLVQALAESGAEVAVDPQGGKAVVRLLVTTLLPLLILAVVFALLMTGRGGGGGVAQIQSFGTLRRPGGGLATPPATRFADVAGADDAVAELAEVVAYLRDPQPYVQVGASPPKGVLLFGPPGTGKTLIARATAGEAGVPFFSVAGAEFVESLVGVGAARVRALFASVRAVAPAIVFIDELDAAGRRRGGEGGGADEREQTLNQLLVEMDGFDATAGIVVMAATNRPDILDPALLRPGRFDRQVLVDPPDVHGRTAILAVHARGARLAADADLDSLARRTPGFTGADLANVVNEAALLAVREGRGTVTAADLGEAVERLVGGPQRRGRVLGEAERDRIATHEAGHAIVVAVTHGPGSVGRLSIVSRGRGLGAASTTGEGEMLMTQSQLQGRITAALAGRTAEELRCGQPSTGAEADLQLATTLARDLVGRFGMADSVGPARLLAADTDVHLGGQTPVGTLSPDWHARFDDAVGAVLETCAAHARRLLITHRALLEGLVQRLLIEEVLDEPALAGLLPQALDQAVTGPSAPATAPSAPAGVLSAPIRAPSAPVTGS